MVTSVSGSLPPSSASPAIDPARAPASAPEGREAPAHSDAAAGSGHEGNPAAGYLLMAGDYNDGGTIADGPIANLLGTTSTA
jgi:hypothetical protein